MTRPILPVILLVLLVGCSYTGVQGCPSGFEELTHTVSFGASGHETWLSVRLADDPEERARGLMWVPSLPEGSGMAFDFDAPATSGFWMKNTLVPLSIAFVGEDQRIVTIREMTPCEAEPCATYYATAPYTVAIEVNAGWFADHGIEVGDRAVLQERICI